MRATRILPIFVAVVIAVGFGTVASAFHHGGVAECIGCHSMHGAASTSRLMAGSDPSSTCLNCHQVEGLTNPSSYHMSTSAADMGPGVSPFQRTPGGDFGWLKKTYTWSTPWGGPSGEAGETHGHNIVAADYSYVPDSENLVAPGGGSLPNDELTCISCHDPHGKYRRIGGDTTYTIASTGAPIMNSGSYQNSPTPTATEAVGVYRLLAGAGYEYDTGASFLVDPPHATAPSSYNKSEETVQVRVAYGTGMAEWCASCHPDMLDGITNGHHPVSQDFDSDTLDNYVAYRGSGDLSGNNSDAYFTLVPYEEGHGDYAVLKTLAASNANAYAGPELTGGQVSCISCHRAHASGFEYAMRWNPESELLTEAGAYPTSASYARGRSQEEMQDAYYDRPASVFGTYQRSLCNKCHAQD